ncbi:hypothetical protein SAMN04488137_1559 [Fictibacillus solisalsi]|uniref:Pullulanase n=1 Tax=Fictibacillus solisalsi TaxID=459525 RepID=A0A1G9VFC2_9BACL|nr:DUF6509 family protein [Fictibacillus solisalsi]SDM70978.1 hypothetical protein SAMN04488137_1559 [Fictibacillus solisalsi]
MEITRHTMEKLQDPTGILEGERYEFIIHVDVEEDDELYVENGIYVKLIYAVLPENSRIVQYTLYENYTDNVLDFELEEEEEQELDAFCKNMLSTRESH